MNDSNPNLLAATRFFQQLYAGVENGFIILFNKKNAKSSSHPVTHLDKAAQTAIQVGSTADVYYSLGLQSHALPSSQRGAVDQVITLPGIAFDIDYGKVGHKKNTKKETLPSELNIALAWLLQAAAPLTPSLLVHTGGGIHAYWLFKEPILIHEVKTRHRLSQLSSLFQNYLIKKAFSDQQWEFDNTATLTQLLRIPGTFNHKSDEKRKVDFLELELDDLTAPRYTPEELEQIGKAKSKKSKQKPFTEKDADNLGKEDKKKEPEDKEEDEDDFRPDIEKILPECAFLKHCQDDADSLSEPEWHAMLSLLGRCKDGENLAHEWSSNYPGYSRKETEQKLNAVINRAGPFTCQAVSNRTGGVHCQSCQHWEQIKTPLVLGLKVPVSKEWIYIIGTKRFANRSSNYILDKEQFSDRYAHVMKKGKPHELILKQDWLIKAIQPTYEPMKPKLIGNGDDSVYYNLWVPSKVMPEKGGVEPWEQHLEYLLPDFKERKLIIDFMAYLVQCPGEKVHYAMLLQGKSGTGKSYLGWVMRLIMGESNVRYVSNDELHEVYTGWMKQSQLIVVEEMMAKGRLELMNKLKPLITQPVVSIREMYTPAYEMNNRMNFLLFTNHKDAIIIDEYDRRYCVIHSPVDPQEPAYYLKLFNWTQAHIGRILQWLLNVDLTTFTAKANAPMTQAKRDTILDSLPPLHQWILQSIEDRSWPFHSDIINVNHLMECLPNSFKNSSPHAIGRALKALNCQELGPHKLSTGAQVRLWTVRRHEVWLSAATISRVAEYEKFSMNKEPGGNPIADARPY